MPDHRHDLHLSARLRHAAGGSSRVRRARWDGRVVRAANLDQIDWPRGTVFTRAQLEADRDGRPYAEE